MNIYDSITADHNTMRSLLSKLVALPDDDQDGRSQLVSQIRDELVPHSRAEENVLYNSLRSLTSDTHPVWHGYREHMEAEALLRALQVTDAINTGWRATAKQLQDALEHHMDEEEDEIFALARKTLTQPEADMLGTAFRSLKPEIKEEGMMKTTLDMVTNMMPPRLSKYLGIDKGTPSVTGQL